MQIDMKRVASSIGEWVKSGSPIPHDLGRLPTWEQDKRAIDKGGSANHGLELACAQYMSDDPPTQSRARKYILSRGWFELSKGVGYRERMSPVYNALPLCCWPLMAWTAWTRGDEEVYKVAAAITESMALLLSLGTVPGGPHGLKIRTPGDRCDIHNGLVAAVLRRTEAAALGHLLKIRVDFTPGRASFWHPLLEALRAADNVQRIIRPPEARICRKIIADKTTSLPERLGQIPIYGSPVRWEAYGRQSYGMWTLRGEHPQDPACLGVVVWRGSDQVLVPGTPSYPESGWASTAKLRGRSIEAAWKRKGSLFDRQSLQLPDRAAVKQSRTLASKPGMTVDIPVMQPDPEPDPDPRPEPPEPPKPDKPTVRDLCDPRRVRQLGDRTLRRLAEGALAVAEAQAHSDLEPVGFRRLDRVAKAVRRKLMELYREGDD